MAKKTRGDFASIERRRNQVLDMLYQGVPQTTMAKVLDVNKVSIETDIAYWRKKFATRIRDMRTDFENVEVELGNLMTQLEQIRQNALLEYTTSNTEAGKNSFLNTAMKATNSISRLLIETGVLPKAGTDINVRKTTRVTFAQQFGEKSPIATLDDEKSRRRVLDAASRVMKASALTVTEAELNEE